MNRADEHLQYEELAVGHALSALEPEEEQLFLAHLATCARCVRDVAQHQAVLGELAGSVELVEPPPALWEGIRAGLTPGKGPSSRAPEEDGREHEAPVLPLSLDAARERKALRTSRWAPYAAAAAAVVALGTWNLDLRADRAAEQARADGLAVAVRELGQADGRRIPLESENGVVVATAVVQDRSVSLVVDGLAPNDDGTRYVLWTQSAEGELRPVEAFDVSDDGVDVVLDLPVEQGTSAVAAFAVSREQGATPPPQPLGPVVASGLA